MTYIELNPGAYEWFALNSIFYLFEAGFANSFKRHNCFFIYKNRHIIN